MKLSDASGSPWRTQATSNIRLQAEEPTKEEMSSAIMFRDDSNGESSPTVSEFELPEGL